MFNKENAYKLVSPEDHREFYDDWANTYDEDFIKKENYRYPKKITNIYIELANSNHTPIADIGCGTGVVGRYFKGTDFLIDGYDISNGMLIEARKKNFYRELYELDITESEKLPKSKYNGIISCGTFTFGHLGAEYLINIIEMLDKGGLGVIGINKAHFTKSNFKEEVKSLESSKKINEVRILEEPIYSDEALENVNNIQDDEIANILTFKVS